MKNLLLSLVIIATVASIAVMGIYANFTDIETSTDNTFETGGLNMWLENPQGVGEEWGDSVLATWHYENKFPPSDPDLAPWYGRMQPGDIINSYVSLKAEGSLAGNYVEIHCENINEELDMDTDMENIAEDNILGINVPLAPGNGVYDKDKVMVITYMKYHQKSIIWNGGTSYNASFFANGDPDDDPHDGWISLHELESHPLVGLTPTPSTGIVIFDMDVKFLEGDWNEYQGDRTNMTLIFMLMQ
ncbi:MAG: hypothetical protein PHQ86_01665 [Dehalococcoidales bacterium]|nr:hypothetical protein [Dehalococcoidales bacterium]